MNLIRLAGMVQSLGLNVNFAALAPLMPLLSKKAVEVTSDDVSHVLGVFSLKDIPSLVINETAKAIQTSDFDTIADILGEEKFLYPMMQKLLMSNSRLRENIAQAQPYVMIRCSCGRDNPVDRKQTAVMAPNAIVEVRCVACEQTRELQAEAITNHIG